MNYSRKNTISQQKNDGQSYSLGITQSSGLDHHAVFSRQRVDVFKDGEVVSTQSARQHKDATDLVLQGTGQLDSHPRRLGLSPLQSTGQFRCHSVRGLCSPWHFAGASGKLNVPCCFCFVYACFFVGLCE